MSPSLARGDVFTVGEKEYIFLANTSETIYAALILDIESSKQVEKILSKKMIRNKSINSTLFCNIKLTTSRYKNRIASLTQPAISIDKVYKKSDFKIEQEDIDKLIDEIKDSHITVIELRELISS